MPEIMSEREQNIFNMFRATTEFDAMNAADYADLEEAAAQFVIVRDAISKLENYAATKTSGERGQAVELKSVIRLAMRRKMKNFAKQGAPSTSIIPACAVFSSFPKITMTSF